MTAAEKMTPPAPQGDDPPPDPFAWESDPTVLVSRRSRILMFPQALVERTPSAAEVAAWYAPDAGAHRTRSEQMLSIHAGVTFLGAYTTSWDYLHTTPGHAPTGAPRPDKCLLVRPMTKVELTDPRSGNVDPETRRLIPAKVRAILHRIVGYLKDQKLSGAHDLFTAPDGFDAPELMLLPLSEVIEQRTERGQQAHAMVINTIPHLRRDPQHVATPLGALHDYALRARHNRGAAIVAACRTWAARRKIGIGG